MMANKAELTSFYQQTDRDDQYERMWGYVNPVSAAYWQMRDQLVVQAVLDHFDPLTMSLRVLEVGVGYGHELSKFALLDIPQPRLTGIDLVVDRLVQAHRIYPVLNISEQNALTLAFKSASFDIVCQFTCFMHMKSLQIQSFAAQEMQRVLKPGGIIIWWDIVPQTWRTLVIRRLVLGRKAPVNLPFILYQTFRETLSGTLRERVVRKGVAEYVNPISKQDLFLLFPGMEIKVHYAGLDYLTWNAIWPTSPGLAALIWRSGRLAQHCFAILKK